jgi:hypothetical protein
MGGGVRRFEISGGGFEAVNLKTVHDALAMAKVALAFKFGK